jgi:hypothetical protein
VHSQQQAAMRGAAQQLLQHVDGPAAAGVLGAAVLRLLLLLQLQQPLSRAVKPCPL